MDIERIVLRRATKWDENYKYAVSKEEDVRTEIPQHLEWAQSGQISRNGKLGAGPKKMRNHAYESDYEQGAKRILAEGVC